MHGSARGHARRATLLLGMLALGLAAAAPAEAITGASGRLNAAALVYGEVPGGVITPPGTGTGGSLPGDDSTIRSTGTTPQGSETTTPQGGPPIVTSAPLNPAPQRTAICGQTIPVAACSQGPPRRLESGGPGAPPSAPNAGEPVLPRENGVSLPSITAAGELPFTGYLALLPLAGLLLLAAGLMIRRVAGPRPI